MGHPAGKLPREGFAEESRDSLCSSEGNLGVEERNTGIIGKCQGEG